MYIRSEITIKKNIYIASIVWSWYGLQHYSEYEFFETLDEANNWVLKKRTNNTLVYDLEDKKDG